MIYLFPPLTFPEIEELARRLDGLPLSLSHAGSYIAQRKISGHKYLQKYDQELAGRRKLLQHVPRMCSYNLSMMTTWEISLKAIKAESQIAVEFLTLCSFLHNSDIFYELFKSSFGSEPKWLHEIALDEDLFQDQIELLSNFSFVQLNSGFGSESYSIHPVIQDWARDRLEKAVWLENLQRAIFVTGAATPRETSPIDWMLRRRLILHADRCKTLLDNFPATKPAIFFFLDRLGNLYYECGRLQDAEFMQKRALEAYSQNLGSNDEMTLHVMNYLAVVYKAQGKLKEAEKILRKAIKGFRTRGTSAQSALVGSCGNLANIYLDQRKMTEAKLIFQLVVQYWEGVEDTSQVNLYESLLNLSNVLRLERNLVEAENNLQRALHGYKRVLGPDDMKTFICINNLGNVYWDQGRRPDARAMYQQALAGLEKSSGLTHASTLDTVVNLGKVYLSQGNLEEAEAFFQRALNGYERLLGPKHSKTLLCIQKVGTVYKAQNHLADAEHHCKLALQGFEAEFGPNNTSSISALHDLGCVYGEKRKFAEAEVSLQQALTRSEEILGPEHADTLQTVSNLALLYEDQKRPKLAEAHYRRAIEGFEKTLGPQHVSTLEVVQRSGTFYFFRGNLKEAKGRYEQALKGLSEALGPNDSLTSKTAKMLSQVDEAHKEILWNIPQEPTTRVKYMGMCGSPDIDGYAYPFNYVEQAPSSLCNQPHSGNIRPDPNATGRFLTSLISRHNDEILQSRSWLCSVCGKAAQELYHSAIPFLSPGVDAAPDFEPSVWDTVVPICRSAGNCDLKAQELTGVFGKQSIPALNPKAENCDECGMVRNVKRCSGCKLLRQVPSGQ